MANTQILALTVERFKSYEKATRIELKPLTVVLGRNSGGKSTLIQSLLLLKQTLSDPRSEVPIKLEGLVEAFSLRELTWGWPPANGRVPGPIVEIEWSSDVDIAQARQVGRFPDLENLAKHSSIDWFRHLPASATLRTSLRIETADHQGVTRIDRLVVRAKCVHGEPVFVLTQQEGGWRVSYRGSRAEKISVEVDHFVPYLQIDRSDLGPRDRQRAWFNAWLILFAQPLESLKRALTDLQYLGSTRAPPPSLFRPATVAPQEIGVSGEFAAQLLHRRERDVVHYLPALVVTEASASIPENVLALPLVDAVNSVLEDLSIGSRVKVEVVQDIGFRLLFGNASLTHVGRGLTYLLPLVELGLFADPHRFSGSAAETPLADYLAACESYSHIALEEPEAHLHPKVQSRLAHWLVSLALSRRRLIVETHSDHLVRRLRGLAARAGVGSPLEKWLLENVAVIEVEQDAQGRSTVRTGGLTAEGGITESWPADFMDEASAEDSAIFYAGLAKAPVESQAPVASPFIHDEGDEDEVEP